MRFRSRKEDVKHHLLTARSRDITRERGFEVLKPCVEGLNGDSIEALKANLVDDCRDMVAHPADLKVSPTCQTVLVGGQDRRPCHEASAPPGRHRCYVSADQANLDAI